MAGIVDVPARTGNRPAAIQRFQAIHDSRQIFDDGQVAPGEFSQHPHARLAMVDRLGNSSASLRASIRSLLFPSFSRAFLRGLQTTTLATWGLSRSYSQAAQVPSSKVTDKVPRSPAKNSRMVEAFVSRMDSITTLPLESITATEMVA